MRTVFKHSVVEAIEEGTLALILVCGREFMGMPFNILKELWHEVQGEDINMQDTSFAPWKPGSWGDSVWAGLPHLLIAILFALTGALANTILGTISGIVIALVLLGGLLATIYYTWRNRWPAWSASWYGYIGLIILLFSTLPYQYWEGLADRIFAGIRFVILLLCLVTLLYWLSRRNPIEGLLMAIPVIILYWFPVMEFIPNSIRFWLTFWLFLLPALTATAVTRLNDIKKAVWLVLGASVLNGLPIAYARTYWNNIPPEHYSPPTIGQMAELFAVPWLASGALVLGPILGWGLWNLGRKYGNVGRVGAVLVISGMIVNLFGHFSYWWWFSKQTYLNALQIFASYQPGEASSMFMVSAGWTAILVGAVGFAVLTWKQNKLLSVALILVPLALPLLAMFSIYFGYRIIPAGFSFQFVELNVAYIFLIFLAGIAWLAMGGWTVTRLYNPPLREGTA
ncbi:MAG: hypothetical protein ACXW4E_07010 [Anaerolineales bacterium]